MRRYQFLSKENVFDALNKLRAAFLAAKDGHDVEEIIKGILTSDERLRVGRRIKIAQLISQGKLVDEIAEELKIGNSTISWVQKNMDQHPRCFELIGKREEKVEGEAKDKMYRKVGGPKMVFKKSVYTGFTRKDVAR
ncbi:MAG: Trp family transcriptional regulator [Patescibacteria group bacterium]